MGRGRGAPSGGLSKTIPGNCQFHQIVTLIVYCRIYLKNDTHHTKRDSPGSITKLKSTNANHSAKEALEADKRSEGTSNEENRCYWEVERGKNSAKYCSKQT